MQQGSVYVCIFVQHINALYKLSKWLCMWTMSFWFLVVIWRWIVNLLFLIGLKCSFSKCRRSCKETRIANTTVQTADKSGWLHFLFVICHFLHLTLILIIPVVLYSTTVKRWSISKMTLKNHVGRTWSRSLHSNRLTRVVNLYSLSYEEL